MTDTKQHVYEGMFLFPQAQSAKMAESIDHIKEILDKSEAELLAMTKWGEGNLAYPIKKNRRGLYILTYFKSDPVKMVNIERDSNLSELILRFMLTRADHLSMEDIQALDGHDAMILDAKAHDDKIDDDDDVDLDDLEVPDDLEDAYDSLKVADGFRSPAVVEPVADSHNRDTDVTND